MLYGLAVFDELANGMASVSTPDIERSLGASHARATAILFLVPGIVAFAIEPWLFVLADRYPRRWFIRGGVAAMAIASVIAAFSSGSHWRDRRRCCGVRSGWRRPRWSIKLPSAEDTRARTIARWTLWSLIGDVGAPALLAVLAVAGFGWRTGYGIVAVVLAGWTLALAFAPIEGVGDDDDDSVGVLAAFREALRDRTLLAWLFATALCDLLDEIFVVLASIRVRDGFGASAAWQTATIVAFVAGDVIGLVVLDRVLKPARELRVLAIAAAGCAIAYVVWLPAPSAAWNVVLIAPVGLFAGPLYTLRGATGVVRRGARGERSRTVAARWRCS